MLMIFVPQKNWSSLTGCEKGLAYFLKNGSSPHVILKSRVFDQFGPLSVVKSVSYNVES